ncbi:MAG: hypothetical protein Q7U38_02400, partial [Methylobacter sp.]|nr:hypothetical protein [Methylobacter sp.]
QLNFRRLSKLWDFLLYLVPYSEAMITAVALDVTKIVLTLRSKTSLVQLTAMERVLAAMVLEKRRLIAANAMVRVLSLERVEIVRGLVSSNYQQSLVYPVRVLESATQNRVIVAMGQEITPKNLNAEDAVVKEHLLCHAVNVTATEILKLIAANAVVLDGIGSNIMQCYNVFSVFIK